MRKYFLALGVIIIAFTLLACATTGPRKPTPKPEETFPVEEVLKVIKAALADTEAEIQDSGLPSLESVTVTFQTELVRTSEAGLKLLVIGGKQSLETSETGQLTISLTPKPSGQAEISQRNLYKSLKEAIVSAAAASKKAREVGEAGQPKLKLDSVEIEFEFSVTSTQEGGIEVEVSSVGISGTLTEARTGGHTINITFKDKS